MKYFGGLNRGAVEEYDRDAQETKSATELLNYQQLNPLDTISGNAYPSRGNIRAAGGSISMPAFMAGFNYVKPYEDGGILKTQGGNFSNGISYINEGGTHEENPLQGVPMGFDHQGTPNVVEQNETIYDDYVYSNRLHPSKEFMAQYKIASGPHPTFADISKKFGKESAERPNDPISRAGLDVQMRALRDEQERVKAELEARKQQAQDDFLRAMGVDPQEAAMQDQMVEQGIMQDQMAQQQQIAQEQAMQEQAMQEEALRQQLAQEQAMQEGGEEVPVDEYGNPMYAAYGGGLHRYDYGGPVNKFAGPNGSSKIDTSGDSEDTTTRKYRPNWMQMVPIYGNLGMVTSDLLGLTNKPKYTEANAILSSIAGPKYISANPRETYYNPKLLDSNWLTNLHNAQRASDMRYAADAAGMRSPGAAIAGRIVANNKYNKSLSELNQQMIEANNKNRLEQAQVGLQNNKNIMDELDKAGAANQSAWNDYADRKLQGTTEAMTQRYKERSDTDLAKGQNLSNLYKSAGNLGDTLFNAMRILGLYKTGAFGPLKDDAVDALIGTTSEKEGE